MLIGDVLAEKTVTRQKQTNSKLGISPVLHMEG